jgi:hypothetical protein
MNVRNPDITGPCHHLKTGARIRAQHEHIKNVTTHPALTGEGGFVVRREVQQGQRRFAGRIDRVEMEWFSSEKPLVKHQRYPRTA